MYYIYTLSCPFECEVKYVGCTKNLKARFDVHVMATTASKKMKPWLLGLKEANVKPILDVYFETEDYDTAIRKEIEAFDVFQKGQLLSIDPVDRIYVDHTFKKKLDEYYRSKFFLTLMASRIQKTKSFQSFCELTQKINLEDFRIASLASNIDAYRIKGLPSLEKSYQISTCDKQLIRDILTNNYIQNE